MITVYICVTPKAMGDYPLTFMLVREVNIYDPFMVMWRRVPTLHVKMNMEENTYITLTWLLRQLSIYF